jgi:hypothetical protein
MRSKMLKINGSKVEGILLCGGPGFKVYSIHSLPDGLAIQLGPKTYLVSQESHSIVIQYATSPYQPKNSQKDIENNFLDYLQRLKSSQFSY